MIGCRGLIKKEYVLLSVIKVKILIISQYYYPEQFQINEIAPELVRRGHEVTVVCGLPNYPKGEIFEGYEKEDVRRKKEEEYLKETGVEVIHCLNVPRGNNPLSLIRNYISFYRNANKVVDSLSDDYDVVFCYQLSPITMALPAIRYKKRTSKPLLLYCLDIWPESALAHVKFKKGLLYRYITRHSGKIYRDCDRILVTSEPFINYLSRKHEISEYKFGYLPQHADGGMLDHDFTKTEKDGKIHFMYAGNMGAGQTLDVIVKAAAILGKRDDYVVDMVGDGSKRAELEEMVSANGLSANFVFHGNQKRADMPSFYKKADALLITLRGNNAVGDTMPGKLQMYMAVGKPILGAINGAAHQVIEEAQCGSCVKAGDYKGLARLIEFYIGHPKEYDACGKNARCYFQKHFTFEHYMNELEVELRKLITEK